VKRSRNAEDGLEQAAAEQKCGGCPQSTLQARADEVAADIRKALKDE
jgi:hypothetical protein